MYQSISRARTCTLAFVVVMAASCGTLAVASPAAATTGTITVSAGGTRSATNTDSGYADAQSGVPFEKATWVSDPTTATWSPLCVTSVTGSCTSALVPNGRYLVRETQGGPFGWRIVQDLAWGGSSSGASPTRSYVGDVTVNSNSATVHPSTSWSPTAPSSSSGPFIVAKNNPPLPSQCGLNVLLLIDRSGSIGPQAATYKAAAQQFVTTMSGTPTNLKIYSFSQDATADQNTFLDLSNPADVTTANSKLNSIYNNPGGATNWDAGMQLAATAGVDVVVFITDGNPTYRVSTSSGANSDGGGTVDLLDLTAGMASANKVKTVGKSAVIPTGATILALGVGTGVTAANLAAVSGPDEGVDYSTSAASGLDSELQQIANKLCGARIHIRKLTDEGDATAAKPGWTFTAGKPAGSPLTFTPGAITTTGQPADDVIKVDKVPAAGASATVAETAQANYSFAASACQKDSFPAAASGGSATATIASVGRNDDWYCTFRNVRQTGTITVVKNLVPASDAGRFDLGVDGGSQATNVGDGGSTGAVSVKTGASHSVAETAHAGTASGDYDSAYVCTDNGTQVSSGTGTSVTSINVASQHSVVCTFTNTRKTGTIKIVKSLVPASDAGRFDLNVDGGSAEATNVGDAGTTGAVSVNTGSGHTAAEVAHAGTSLADYTSSYVCKLGANTVATGSGTSVGSLSVAKGDAVVCTFTNVRNTGTIQVSKHLVPASDPGTFDLNVDGGNAEATAVGDGGTTGAVSVNTGSAHTVSEAAAAGSSLGDYTSTYSCSRNGTSFASGSGTTLGDIAVAKGDVVACVFTNQRQTGTLRVKDVLSPASDPGRFDLNADGGASEVTNVGDGGDTGALAVNTGPGHTAAETAHAGTSLTDYTTTYVCTDNGVQFTSGTGSSVGAISIGAGHAVVCVFTNVRKTGSVTVVKHLVPASDPGRFDLGVDGGTQATNVGDAGSTGAVTVNTGSGHSIAESAHSGTSLADYTSSYVCMSGNTTVASGNGATAAGIAVGKDDAVVCTFTNVRKTGTLTVVKHLVPASDPGRFDLGVDGGVQASNVGDAGSTGAVTVNAAPGHSAAESAHAGTSLADYTSTYFCADGNTVLAVGSGTSVPSLSVASGHSVVCTFTNVRNTGSIEVVKHLSPASDPGTFDLGVDGGTQATNVGDGGTTGAVAVNTGSGHSIAESAHAGTSLADYTSSYVCKVGNTTVASGTGTAASGIPVTNGDHVVCAFTNVRKTGTIKVIEHSVPTSDPGTFDLNIDGGSPEATDIGDGGATPVVTVNTGPGHTVAETAHAGTNLADYTSSYVCTDNGVQFTSGSGTGLGAISVGASHAVVCTITNTRNPGTIEIIEHSVPTSDPGTFDLNVDGGSPEASDVSDGGTTGSVTVAGGADHSVAEAGHTGTDLADYTSTFVCSDGGDVVASGSGTSLAAVNVASGHHVICIFTNTRKTGTITIHKAVAPASDAGRFNLNVDGGSAEATSVGDGGTTGAVTVNSGAGHTAAEAASPGTSLADYVSTYSCSDGDSTVASGSGTSIDGLSVSFHESLVCTFTNTRKATVTIHEVTVPHNDTASFGFHTNLTGDPTMTLGDGGSTSRTVAPGTFTVSQDDPRAAGYKLTGLVCTESGAQDSTVPAAADIASSRTATIAAQPGESIDCTYTDALVVGSTVVVKTGNEFAYHGDTLTYTFTVTNNGNSPLHNVSVTDDRCANVSAAPVSKLNDNGNTVLDQVGQDGTQPEEWIFTCSMTAPAHVAGETNPIVNTATVHALDEFDRTVTGQAHHSTLLLHPAVSIDKTGPATAVAGDLVTYALVVKNTGDESFAAPLVVVADARCEAPPALVSTAPDATPASFDPGDSWAYLCNVQTQLGETAVHNVGTVDGTDPHGHHATAQDAADTQLTQPAGSVLPLETSPGSGRLRGQTGCATSATATAIVTGKHIASVVFRIDGKKVKTLKKADKSGRFILHYSPAKLSYGVHHVTARITFSRDSGTAAKTLKMALTRCRPAVIKPKFTG